MTLTIELPPLIQSKLETEASQSGMTVEQYARTLLEKSLGRGREMPSEQADADFEDWERELNELVEFGNELNAANIPDEALRRENMYEDREL